MPSPNPIYPSHLRRREMVSWILQQGCWDSLGRLNRQQAQWIAQHAPEWDLVEFPLEFFDYDLEALSHAPDGQPIIVARKAGEWEVLDGQHRVSRALRANQESLPAYVPAGAFAG